MIINITETLTKKYDEDIIVQRNGDLTITGIVNGDIELNEFSSLALNGIVNGKINVKINANAVITGIVNGTVYSDGGFIRITGIVEHISGNSNNFVIEKDAIINGVRQ